MIEVEHSSFHRSDDICKIPPEDPGQEEEDEWLRAGEKDEIEHIPANYLSLYTVLNIALSMAG